jgi:hypothetical protein
VENPRGVTRGVSTIEVDGEPLPSASGKLRLIDDGATHRVRIVLGSSAPLLTHTLSTYPQAPTS